MFVQTRSHNVILIFQVVSEESFVQIDEFYKLITPNADGDEPMKEQQMAASRHIVKFLEASSEAVVETTCILCVSFGKICAIVIKKHFYRRLQLHMQIIICNPSMIGDPDHPKGMHP